MYLFDTNIFLEILLDQEKAGLCRASLEGVNEQRRGWVTSFSLHAIEVILERAGRLEIVRRFLTDLSQDRLFSRYETTTEEELEIARLAPKLSLDFDDTLQYYVAKKRNLSLVTLDRDFRRIKDIPVLAPGEVS